MEPGPPLTTCTCSPNSSGAQGMRATQVSGIQTSLGSRVRPCLKMDEWVKTVSPKSWHLISIFFANFQNDYLYFSNHFHWWYCKDFFWNQLCTDFIHFKSTFEFILSGISSHRLLGVPNGTHHCCFLLFWKLSHLLPTAIAWHGFPILLCCSFSQVLKDLRWATLSMQGRDLLYLSAAEQRESDSQPRAGNSAQYS